MPPKTKISAHFEEIQQAPKYLKHNIHYSKIQFKITGKQRKWKIRSIFKRKQSIQMLACKGFKAANITMLNDIKENILFMKSQQRKRIYRVPNRNSKTES